jgi:hypothetical protein
MLKQLWCRIKTGHKNFKMTIWLDYTEYKCLGCGKSWTERNIYE